MPRSGSKYITAGNAIKEGDRRVNDGHGDCGNVDDNRKEILARHFVVRSRELRFVMMPRDRCAQEEEQNRARKM